MFTVNLNFRIDLIHHAPQLKTWACSSWFDWENFSRDRWIKFLIMRTSLRMFYYLFIWTFFINFLRSHRVYSSKQKLNRKHNNASDYTFQFSCDPSNRHSRLEKYKKWKFHWNIRFFHTSCFCPNSDLIPTMKVPAGLHGVAIDVFGKPNFIILSNFWWPILAKTAKSFDL